MPAVVRNRLRAESFRKCSGKSMRIWKGKETARELCDHSGTRDDAQAGPRPRGPAVPAGRSARSNVDADGRLPGAAIDDRISISMRMVMTESTRLGYALDSLAGLSVGDALGAQYFMVGRKVEDLLAGVVPPPVWEWTDDTEMACSVVSMLAEAGHIDQDRLAASFAERCEPNRGYGAGAFVILHAIRQGMPWAEAAGRVFDGQGSM